MVREVVGGSEGVVTEGECATKGKSGLSVGMLAETDQWTMDSGRHCLFDVDCLKNTAGPWSAVQNAN